MLALLEQLCSLKGGEAVEEDDCQQVRTFFIG